jgi:hypothetical protein
VPESWCWHRALICAYALPAWVPLMVLNGAANAVLRLIGFTARARPPTPSRSCGDPELAGAGSLVPAAAAHGERLDLRLRASRRRCGARVAVLRRLALPRTSR